MRFRGDVNVMNPVPRARSDRGRMDLGLDLEFFFFFLQESDGARRYYLSPHDIIAKLPVRANGIDHHFRPNHSALHRSVIR